MKLGVLVALVAQEQPFCTIDCTILEQKDDFKYLGSWADSSEKDIRIRKILAWKAINEPRAQKEKDILCRHS